MERVAVIGSTGSIGVQTLDVIRKHPDRFRVVSLSCHRNLSVLREQVEEFSPKRIGISDESLYTVAKDMFPRLEIVMGKEAHCGAASLAEADTTLIAVVGFAGLAPLVASIQERKKTCVANKESIVCGGASIVSLAKEHGVQLLPVDSEHNAIFQCLEGNRSEDIEKIYLTCSGGPFRTWKREEIAEATSTAALKHPNWNMGRKISIDSATLANKGLEVMEAKWLFGLEVNQIEVVVHPQSVIHSMVEYRDRSILAQLGPTDMRVAIQYALSYPERQEGVMAPLNLFQVGELTFWEPDRDRFPCFGLAEDAARLGGIYPIVFHAANDVGVEAYLAGNIGFYGISDGIAHAMQRFGETKEPALEDISGIDQEVRAYAQTMV